MLFSLSSAFAGHQFSFTYIEEMADIKVLVVDSAEKADIVAFKSSEKLESSKCWLAETSLDEAELRLMEVDFADQADLKIYFTNIREESSDSCYQ